MFPQRTTYPRLRVCKVLVAATLCAGVLVLGPMARGPADATSPVPPVFGLTVGELGGTSPAAVGALFDDAAAVGVTTVRTDFSWARVQPTATGSFNWTSVDLVVSAANARHLHLLPILDFTPAWARQAACRGTFHCGPADPAQFAAFVAAAAQRYAPQGIHMWEIWNEPNLGGSWPPAPNAVAYSRILVAAARAIKAVDPTAIVISGGLAGATTGPTTVAPTEFLATMCAAGAVSAVDGVGFHPYSFPVPPSYDVAWNAWSQMVRVRGALVACGQPTKPIWATEYGAPTNGPGLTASATDYKIGHSPDHVDEAYQALLVTQSVLQVEQSPWIHGLFWYTDRDSGTDTSNRENFFGLRRADGTAKPAWAALRAALVRGGARG
jgi:hypothetical protein